MKKEVIVQIVIDSDKDEFGINTTYKGFDEKSPVVNSLLVASILEIAKNQELSKFENK